jgi:hypothetical protein
VRISRAVYYKLVALGVREWVGSRPMLGVWGGGQFFALPPPGENALSASFLEELRIRTPLAAVAGRRVRMARSARQ